MGITFNANNLDSIKYNGIDLDTLKYNGDIIRESFNPGNCLITMSGNTSSTSSNKATYITNNFSTLTQITSSNSDVNINGQKFYCNNKVIFKSISGNCMYYTMDFENYISFGNTNYTNIVYSTYLNKYILLDLRGGASVTSSNVYYSSDLNTLNSTDLPNNVSGDYPTHYSIDLFCINGRPFIITRYQENQGSNAKHGVYTTENGSNWTLIFYINSNEEIDGTYYSLTRPDNMHFINNTWYLTGKINTSTSGRVYNITFNDFSGSFDISLKTTRSLRQPVVSIDNTFLGYSSGSETQNVLYYWTDLISEQSLNNPLCNNLLSTARYQGKQKSDGTFWFMTPFSLVLSTPQTPDLYFVKSSSSTTGFRMIKQSYDNSTMLIYDLIFLERFPTIVGVNVEGSCNITNNVLSNFGAFNYAYINASQIMLPQQYSSVDEMQIKFTFVDNNETQGLMSYGGSSVGYYNNDRFTLVISNNNITIFQGQNSNGYSCNLINGNTYILKIQKVDNEYIVYLSENGGVFNQLVISYDGLEDLIKFPIYYQSGYTFKFGIYSLTSSSSGVKPLQGIIDLTECYFKYQDKYIWQGA